MRRVFFAMMLLCPLTVACAGRPVVAPKTAGATIEPVEPWRQASVADDADRIEALNTIWAKIKNAMPVRSRKSAEAEGALLAADAALDHPELPPGSYACRVVRLGEAAGRQQFRSFPSNFCYIGTDGDKMLSLTKQTGSDLPAGRLYPSGDKRYVFLGARQAKAGDNALAYGADRNQDIAGVIERVGSFRWRLVAPTRDRRSLDIYELTPVPVDQQPT